MVDRQTRRQFLGTAAFLGASASAASAVQRSAQAAARRNIVFILSDDHRYDAFSMLGHPFLKTPRFDALAENGILCENAFVTTSLCAPSRASILTGQYTHRHEVIGNGPALKPGTATFPQELQKGGYETAFIGKWHMGRTNDDPRPGFDHWVSFRGQGTYFNPTLNVDGERVKKKGYISDLLTDYAEEFIRRPREKPFCLYLSHKAVHANFEPAPRHKGVYAGQKYPHPASMADTEENYRGKPDWVRAQRNSWHGVDGMYNKSTDFDTFVKPYAETVLGLDDSVGRVVDALSDEGILESTLLIYASDNGFLFGEHGLIDKRTMYEPSIRIPLIVHCPELFPGGQSRKELMLNIDFAPTILETAGVSIPDSIQGRSFLGLLQGKTTDWRKDFLYEYFWEAAFPQTPTVFGVRGERYKLITYHGVWDKYEMYDLVEDPDEMNNLIGHISLGNRAGALDGHISGQLKGETRKAYREMRKRLGELLVETGRRQEPRWGVAP